MGRKGFGHGGAREGSGRKPKYQTDNETVTIKVPKKHKDDAQKVIELMDALIEMGFSPTEIESVLRDAMKKSV